MALELFLRVLKLQACRSVHSKALIDLRNFSLHFYLWRAEWRALRAPKKLSKLEKFEILAQKTRIPPFFGGGVKMSLKWV